jgi:uncharacterized membrane protein YfcA
MEITIYLAFLIILAGLIKGFVGFGLSLILISVLIETGFKAHEFMPILVPLFIILDIILYIENRKFVKLDFKENFTLHYSTLMTLFIGILLGTYLLSVSELNIIKLIFAIIVLLLIFLLIGKVDLHQMRIPSEKNNAFFGFGTGILTGLFTLNAIPVSIYMLYHQYPKEKYMGSLVTFLIFSDILLLAVYLFKDLFTFEGFLVSLRLILMILLGFVIGSLLRRNVSSKYFKSIVILILALNSLKIIFEFFFQ